MPTFPAASGERNPLRLISAANARNFSRSFEGHWPDGHRVAAHEPPDGLITRGAAMRTDILFQCTGTTDGCTRVVDKFFPRRNFILTNIDYSFERARGTLIG